MNMGVAHEHGECATRAERGAGVPASERVGGSGGAKPPGLKRMGGLVMAAALLTAACGVRAEGPPEIVVDRTPCSRCGMLISETLYAAAYQAPGADARVFDDLGCLRDAARGEQGVLRIWVHDAVDGRWMNGFEAILVASPSIRTPMGGGLLAYRTAAAAESAAGRHNGRVIRSIDDILRKEAGL
jgi:nitrous oxide reductase accessory protein NosL